MRTIWKFVLPVTDEQDLEFPKGALFLHVGQQAANGTVVIWMLVDPDNERVRRRVSIRGTGHPITERGGVFLGTVITNPFVWHVFMEHGDLPIGSAWSKTDPMNPVGKEGS